MPVRSCMPYGRCLARAAKSGRSKASAALVLNSVSGIWPRHCQRSWASLCVVLLLHTRRHWLTLTKTRGCPELATAAVYTLVIPHEADDPQS